MGSSLPDFQGYGTRFDDLSPAFPEAEDPSPYLEAEYKAVVAGIGLSAQVMQDHTHRFPDIKPQNILLETAKINDMFEHAPSTVFRHSSPALDAPD